MQLLTEKQWLSILIWWCHSISLMIYVYYVHCFLLYEISSILIIFSYKTPRVPDRRGKYLRNVKGRSLWRSKKTDNNQVWLNVKRRCFNAGPTALAVGPALKQRLTSATRQALCAVRRCTLPDATWWCTKKANVHRWQGMCMRTRRPHPHTYW